MNDPCRKSFISRLLNSFAFACDPSGQQLSLITVHDFLDVLSSKEFIFVAQINMFKEWVAML